MKIKKLVLQGIFFIGFLFSGFDFGHCEEKFPEWVPQEAIEEAKEILLSGHLIDMEIGELQKCELRHPCELVGVDYEHYDIGDSIQKLFDRNEQFLFGIYLDNKWIWEIGVGTKDGHWMFCCSTEITKKSSYEDPLGAIYKQFPISDSIKIYRTLRGERHYFIEINGEIKKIIIRRPYKGTIYYEPTRHMLEEKKRIIKPRRFHSAPNQENQ
jgi:hypothetical protein